MHYFFILFITLSFNSIHSMEADRILSRSSSPAKQTLVSRDSSPKNSRTKSLSPTRKKAQKNQAFLRNDIIEHSAKPRSKTAPEINPIDLPVQNSPRSLSPVRYSKNVRDKEKNNCSPFVIFRSKMDIFNDICFFLQDHNKNPNIQDFRTKQTEFHYAVLSRNEILIDLFLQHPGLNSLITNNDSIAAYQYISGTDIIKYESLYKKLQLRATLDQTIHDLLITDKDFFTTHLLKSDCFQKIDALFSKISQEIIPPYATAEFIFAMIIFRLKHERNALEILHKQYAENLN